MSVHGSVEPFESIFQLSLSGCEPSRRILPSLIQSRDSLWLFPQEPWGMALTVDEQAAPIVKVGAGRVRRKGIYWKCAC